MPRAGVLAAGVLAAGVLVPASGAADTSGATELFRFRDPRIEESSGLVASSYADDVFFTHNDSGDRRGRFFAVDAGGRTLADIRPDVRTTDVEDIARLGHVLWLADIGDNRHQRDEVHLVRVPEPRLTGPVGRIEVPAQVFRLRYADGRHDAESLLVQPGTGRAYVATKSLFGRSALYAAPPRLDPDGVNQLTKVADVPLLPTGGAFSPSGDRFVLRSYRYALVWRVDGGDVPGALRRRPLRVALPAQRQGEGVTFTRGGTRLVVSSEGAWQPVYAVALPEPSPTRRAATDRAPDPAPGTAPNTASGTAPNTASGTAPNTGTDTAERADPDGGPSARPWLFGGLAAVALAWAFAGLARRQRPRGPSRPPRRRR